MSIPRHMPDGSLRLPFGDSLEQAIDVTGYGVPAGATWSVLLKSAKADGTTLLDISAYATWTADTTVATDGTIDIAVPFAEMAAHVPAGTAWLEIAFTADTVRTTLNPGPVKIVVEAA